MCEKVKGGVLASEAAAGGRLGLLEERSWTAASNAIGLFRNFNRSWQVLQAQAKASELRSRSTSFNTPCGMQF